MKRALIAILGLVGLGLLALLVLLGPAHLQVRSVEPPLPSEAQLRALALASGGPDSVRYVSVSTQDLGGRILGHNVFVVSWPDGRLFAIDAGMDEQAAEEFSELMQLMQGGEPAQFHGHIADQLGDDIQRVIGLGLTHLHIDHSQGIVPFCEARGPGARIYQTEEQATLQNLHTTEGEEIIEASCLERGAIGGGPVQTSPALPGLGLVSLGGHTPGSTMFAVSTPDRLWLFSGDITNSREALIDDRGKGFFYSYLAVPENTDRTAELRGWLRDLDARDDITVVVSHDSAAVRESGLTAYER